MSARDVDVRIAEGRTLDLDAFVDLTGQVAEEIRPAEDGWFRVRFPEDLTPEQVEAVRLRARSASSVEETLLGRARTAFAANRAYIDKASTTAAEDKAQVKALTRQMNAIIRLVVRDLDSTDGT